MPSQAPVVPQVDACCAVQMLCGSALPLSTGQQVPGWLCWLQVTHAPSQATLQQTPSAQKCDPHSLAAAQLAPFGLRPQLPFTHSTPSAQSVLVRQVVAHLFVAVSHVNGAQIVEGPARQRPSPSHTLTSLTASPLQVPGLHTVPDGNLRQCPCPSQVPSSPQVDACDATQAPDFSGPPFATNEQIPGALWSLHVLQVSVQAVLQHMPSTQKPL